MAKWTVKFGILAAGGGDFLLGKLCDDCVDIDTLLAVDLTENSWGHGFLDGIKSFSVDDQSRQVVAEYNRVAALQTH